MVTTLLSLLVILLCVWNVEDTPKIAGAGELITTTAKKLGLLSLFFFHCRKISGLQALQ
jgi:hypothetical protein